MTQQDQKDQTAQATASDNTNDNIKDYSWEFYIASKRDAEDAASAVTSTLDADIVVTHQILQEESQWLRQQAQWFEQQVQRMERAVGAGD